MLAFELVGLGSQFGGPLLGPVGGAAFLGDERRPRNLRNLGHPATVSEHQAPRKDF